MSRRAAKSTPIWTCTVTWVFGVLPNLPPRVSCFVLFYVFSCRPWLMMDILYICVLSSELQVKTFPMWFVVSNIHSLHHHFTFSLLVNKDGTPVAAALFSDNEYTGRCMIHLDAFCWVQRDSYLPQGNQVHFWFFDALCVCSLNRCWYCSYQTICMRIPLRSTWIV